MIVGIVGSRRRKGNKDFKKVLDKVMQLEVNDQDRITKIVTGDCDEGGDKFARDIGSVFEIELDIKRIIDPETGEELDFNNHRWFYWDEMVQMFYDRNEEIAKEPLDYLIALVASDRKGGTENTIKHFKRLHKDWKDKLIII